jgi:transposase
MIQTLFPNNDAVYRDDNVPIHTAEAEAEAEEHECELQHLPWPAQTPHLNVTEQLWSVLEPRVRKRFSPPTSLKQLEDILRGEWYKIPLETVKNLYESIPRRTAAVMKAKGGPTPFG